eukprot:15434830-Alexandrium_andersonii.AAC.1
MSVRCAWFLRWILAVRAPLGRRLFAMRLRCICVVHGFCDGVWSFGRLWGAVVCDELAMSVRCAWFLRWILAARAPSGR